MRTFTRSINEAVLVSVASAKSLVSGCEGYQAMNSRCTAPATTLVV